jgi:protein involved in polysaccharide export with SLBB domain
MMRRIVLLLAALAVSAVLPARAAAQTAAADSAFLRPGDLIRVVVFRQPDLSGEFTVSPDGTIQHPLLREVSVVGVPRSVIRERLRTALSRYERDPAFVFDFLYRVAVGGEVRLPNLYNLIPETSVGQAVAVAGGTTEFGRLERVIVLRDGQEITLNLRDPSQAGTRVRSGDQIRVPRRSNVLRDVITPFAAVVAAIAAVIGVVDRP